MCSSGFGLVVNVKASCKVRSTRDSRIIDNKSRGSRKPSLHPSKKTTGLAKLEH